MLKGQKCHEKYNILAYCFKFGDNLELTKFFYIKAIENGCQSSIYQLARHYHKFDKNYDLAIKYYLMGIEINDVNCLRNLNNMLYGQ